MPRISNTSTDEKFLYIKLIDFQDRIEYDIFKRKIELMLKEYRSRVKVF
jgi:hypothetical protein